MSRLLGLLLLIFEERSVVEGRFVRLGYNDAYNAYFRHSVQCPKNRYKE